MSVILLLCGRRLTLIFVGCWMQAQLAKAAMWIFWTSVFPSCLGNISSPVTHQNSVPYRVLETPKMEERGGLLYITAILQSESQLLMTFPWKSVKSNLWFSYIYTGNQIANLALYTAAKEIKVVSWYKKGTVEIRLYLKDNQNREWEFAFFYLIPVGISRNILASVITKSFFFFFKNTEVNFR